MARQRTGRRTGRSPAGPLSAEAAQAAENLKRGHWTGSRRRVSVPHRVTADDDAALYVSETDRPVSGAREREGASSLHASPPPRQQTRGDGRRSTPLATLLVGAGELSLTSGVVLMLFVAYTLWGTGHYTHEQQRELKQDLTRRSVSAPVRTGGGVALIRIPRFGAGYSFAVIEGVGPAELRKGPGHYPGTALPGGVGNFVVSGHRTTYAAPFDRLDELRDGDQILIDYEGRRLTYRVTGRSVVDPSNTTVIAPVPFHPGRRPTRRFITLTTCHPKYSAARRLIIFGVLAGRMRGR